MGKIKGLKWALFPALLMALALTGAWAFQLQDRVSESEASLASFGTGTQLPLYSPETAGVQGKLVMGSDGQRGMLDMQLVPNPERAYKLVGVKEGEVVEVADLEVNDQGVSAPFSSEQPYTACC